MITSPVKLMEFIKEALGTHISNESIKAELSAGPTKPSMLKVHNIKAPKRPHLAPETELKKCRDTLALVQVTLANSQEENRALQVQMFQLRQENESLLIELLRQRESNGHNNKIILGLLDQIAGICYEGSSVECDCAAKDSTQKTNSAK
jgi:hypothetical protein